MIIMIRNNSKPDDDGDVCSPRPSGKNLRAGAERGAGPPHPRFSEPFRTCGRPANCGTWGSSGHCAGTWLPGFTHAGGRGAAQGAAGLCGAGGLHPAACRGRPRPAGKGGAGPSSRKRQGPP